MADGIVWLTLQTIVNGDARVMPLIEAPTIPGP